MQLTRLSDAYPASARLRVAETCVATRALGPGLRSVAWVQGCPFRCRGCLAPDWIPPDAPARDVRPADLAAELLAHPGVTGITFSGGEPMAQAAGLAEVIAIARRERDLTLICFTGYRLAELKDRPPGPGVAELLAQTDVLIDGRYVAARNDGHGLRGSSNQQVHMLTGPARARGRRTRARAEAYGDQGARTFGAAGGGADHGGSGDVRPHSCARRARARGVISK